MRKQSTMMGGISDFYQKVTLEPIQTDSHKQRRKMFDSIAGIY